MANQVYDDEIDLREYIEVIRKRWKVIAYCMVLFTVIALVHNLMQAPFYEAKTTLLVRFGGSGTSGGLSQVAGLAGLAGMSLTSGGGSLMDFTEVMQSRAVAKKVLEDLKLQERVKGWNDPKLSRQKLVSKVRATLLKSKTTGNLVELRVEFRDPQIAAEIANGYADALSYYWNKLNYTEAKKKKEYIETQLPKVEGELRRAEAKYKQFTLLLPKMNSAFEMAGLSGSTGGGQQSGIEIGRLSRELEVQNSVYTMLRKEYETVKLEAAKEIPPFSVVDEAVPPLQKSKPNVKTNTLIGLMLGLFIGVSLAFVLDYWEGLHSA